MSTLLETSTSVLPGAVVCSGDHLESSVVAGPGVRLNRRRDALVSARAGVVHWEGSEVSVLVPSASHISGENKRKRSGIADERDDSSEIGIADPVAPTIGSTVLIRLIRVTRQLAQGDIIAVGQHWCRGFRASIRPEDVGVGGGSKAAAGSPTTPSGPITIGQQKQLQAESGVAVGTGDSSNNPLLTSKGLASLVHCFRQGDLVVADVVALSEARLYQCATAAPHCGVVRGMKISSSLSGKLLRAVPGRRDVLAEDDDGSASASALAKLRTVPRWAPLHQVPSS